MSSSARTWVKLTAGVLLIGTVFVVLWAENRPNVRPIALTPTPTPEPLRDARAVIELTGRRPGRARIACDGARQTATGFWAGDPRRACEALASTRGPLLAGPGCPRTHGTALRARGVFGAERFDHRAQLGGCPDPDGWLAVAVLVSPRVDPDQEAEEPESP
jgi:hypothetical protein